MTPRRSCTKIRIDKPLFSKVPRGCVRCLCGAYVVKGDPFYTHLKDCPAMTRYAAEHNVKTEDLYTPFGWKLMI